MAALNAILIINIIGMLMIYEHGVDLLTFEINTLILQAALYAIEIFIYILFIFKMKRKLLIVYFIFLIIVGFLSAFTGSIGLLIRAVLVYFVFQSQWDKFKK